jgi:hypothetical protein
MFWCFSAYNQLFVVASPIETGLFQWIGIPTEAEAHLCEDNLGISNGMAGDRWAKRRHCISRASLCFPCLLKCPPGCLHGCVMKKSRMEVANREGLRAIVFLMGLHK